MRRDTRRRLVARSGVVGSARLWTATRDDRATRLAFMLSMRDWNIAGWRFRDGTVVWCDRSYGNPAKVTKPPFCGDPVSPSGPIVVVTFAYLSSARRSRVLYTRRVNDAILWISVCGTRRTFIWVGFERFVVTGKGSSLLTFGSCKSFAQIYFTDFVVYWMWNLWCQLRIRMVYMNT